MEEKKAAPKKLVTISPSQIRAEEPIRKELNEFFSYPGDKFLFNPSPTIVFLGNMPIPQSTLYKLDDADIEIIKNSTLLKKMIADKRLILLKDTEIDEDTLIKMAESNKTLLDRVESGELDDLAGQQIKLDKIDQLPPEEPILLETLKKETENSLDPESIAKIRKRVKDGKSRGVI